MRTLRGRGHGREIEAVIDGIPLVLSVVRVPPGSAEVDRRYAPIIIEPRRTPRVSRAVGSPRSSPGSPRSARPLRARSRLIIARTATEFGWTRIAIGTSLRDVVDVLGDLIRTRHQPFVAELRMHADTLRAFELGIEHHRTYAPIEAGGTRLSVQAGPGLRCAPQRNDTNLADFFLWEVSVLDDNETLVARGAPRAVIEKYVDDDGILSYVPSRDLQAIIDGLRALGRAADEPVLEPAPLPCLHCGKPIPINHASLAVNNPDGSFKGGVHMTCEVAYVEAMKARGTP